MLTVSFDDRSFLVDGKPVWLASGAIHYFRIPAALWRDRLLKAKRAGLNCVETYIAWNFHEPHEGKWELTGDHDVAAFVRLAGELGLYVILRPGPYICAEWDFGGLPAWLAAKSGIAYRTNNAAFTHYYDKYFRQVLPRLAELQVSRGGNVILIQNENEYRSTTMPERLNYLEFISQMFRRNGFDIPIINCNRFSDPPLGNSIECVNTWAKAVQQLKKLRLRQGNKPLLVSEFRCGWFDGWGGTHNRRDGRETARRALEILGCGGQFNYYMFHGGTNFAFWGARLNDYGDDTYQTTSYDFDAPLAEGGGLTEKYYLTRLVNMLANHMGPYLARCAMTDIGATVHDSTQTLNIAGPAGRWAVVTNNGRADITSARLSLPNDVELKISLEPIGATAIPIGVKLTDAITLDYANVMPLGFFGEKILVFHGPARQPSGHGTLARPQAVPWPAPAVPGGDAVASPAGWQASISINGAVLKAEIPAGEDPKVIEHQGLLVVLVSSDLAMRTWWLDDALVFGPKFVGNTLEEVEVDARTSQYAVLTLADGNLTHYKAKPTPPVPSPPKLSAWSRVGVCREPVAADLEWRKIERPRSVEHLGVPYGYVWYRTEIPQGTSGKRHLFLPQCEDRAIIYVNGALAGIWGRGAGATRTPIPAHFKSHQNVITILADNLGRPMIDVPWRNQGSLRPHLRRQGIGRREVQAPAGGNLPAADRPPPPCARPGGTGSPEHLRGRRHNQPDKGLPHPPVVPRRPARGGYQLQ